MLPQVRQSSLYPGQPGVSGSDVQRGLRWEPAGIVLYVDENHPGASATADGTNPEAPQTTIANAITNLIAFATATADSLEGSVIVVAAEATIAETVIVPSPAPHNCTILGAGSSSHAPTWAAATAAGTALTLRVEGWTVEGITFETGAAGTAIRLDEVPGSSYSAYKTTIRNCRFDGLWGGLYGVNFSGAPHRVLIEGCEFLEYRRGDASAFAIYVTDSTHTNPYECHVHGNMFWENENHIGNLGSIRGFNVSTFIGNTFYEGQLIATTLKLDLRGGSQGNNIVTGNFMGGVYSQAGGYYAHAGATNQGWIGNTAEPTPATVADNGKTIAVPA